MAVPPTGFSGEIEAAGLAGGAYGGQVTALDLKEILRAHLEIPWPPLFLWGPPGVGKSSVVRQVATAMGLELVDLRMLLLDPVDLRGLPVPEGRKVIWAPPAFLPERGRGILFLDELNAAPPLVQASVYQLVLDRKLGEYTLPDGWHIVAAGNRESDRSIAHTMPSALLSRFEHLELVPDLDSWRAWAFEAAIDPSVIAFLEFRPELLYRFTDRSKAFPCPRTWEMVSRVLPLPLSAAALERVLEGCVGPGPATEFSLFRRNLAELPRLEEIAAGRDLLPSTPASGYAIVSGLVARYGRDPARRARMLEYAVLLGRHGWRELEVLLVRDLLRRDPALARDPGFEAWARENVGALG